jgi:hypothetical protein
MTRCLWGNHPGRSPITPEEALQCYTLNGAFASFEEKIGVEVIVNEIDIVVNGAVYVPSVHFNNIPRGLIHVAGPPMCLRKIVLKLYCAYSKDAITNTQQAQHHRK